MSEIAKLFVTIGAQTKGFETGLKNISTRMGTFGKQVSAVGGGLTKYVTGPIIGAVGGLFALAKATANAGDEIQKMALRTGFSTEALSELKHAANLSGTSIEQLETATKRMSRMVLDASRGLDSATRAFDALGISVEELEGLSPEAQFMRISSALADVEDHTTKAALAQEIFGRAGTQLLPMLAAGSDGLAAMRQEAHDLGLVFDQEAADAAAKFNDDLERLKGAFTGLTREIGNKVIPIVIDHLIPAIKEHVIPAIRSLVDRIMDAIQWFQELDPQWQKIIGIAIGFAVAIGPVLLIVGKLISIGGVLIGVIKGIGVALMFLYANPVGLIILGIAALIAAGVALYRNWDKVKVYAKIAWEYIKHGFEWMVVQISRFLNNLRLGFLTAINAILNLVAPIARILPAPFRDAFNSIKESVENNIDNVRDNLDRLDNRLDESRGRLVDNVNRMRRSLHDLSDSVMTVGGVVADLDGNIMQDFSHATQAVTKQTGSTAAAFGDAADSASSYAKSVASASKSVADAAVAPLGLAERLRADIARVEAMRGDPGKEEFFRPFGGIEGYLASQHARLQAAPIMSDASAPGTLGPQVIINIHGPISSRDDVDYYADEIVKRLRLAGVIPS